MSTKKGLKVTKPVSIWNANLTADFRQIFKSLGKAVISASTGNWNAAAKDTLDAISTTGLKQTPEAVAWLFLTRAISQAIFSLVGELQEKLDISAEFDVIGEDVADLIEQEELALDETFFEVPQSLPFLPKVADALEKWLVRCGLPQASALIIKNRFPSYFVYSLHDEWRKKKDDYSSLVDAFNSPFLKATRNQQAWDRYNGWLQKCVDLPLFEESFGLRQIYVPLRAYYDRKTDNEIATKGYTGPVEHRFKERVVVDLFEEIDAWVNAADSRDALRVISGGPGSGKSSYAKMLASDYARSKKIRLLFVPLHLLDITDDLEDALREFVRYDPNLQSLTQSPLDPEVLDRLLLIFDGLDELSQQGRVGLELARDFIREVERYLRKLNTQEKARLLVLFTGRQVVVQSNESEFRKPRQLLHVLPYYIPEEERQVFQWRDEKGMLSVDQRNEWWTRYGHCVGERYSRIPKELDRGRLREITSQPLLNYLVALTRKRGNLKFASDTSLNLVYGDLLQAVYQRGWESYSHRALENIKFEDFIRLLEEIGVSAWHGHGRTTTVGEIERHCEYSGLKELLSTFQESAKQGVTRLLTAFYFRQCGDRRDGEATFEFTHKSFGEYLAARRVVRLLEDVADMLKLSRERPGVGWDELRCLEEFARICGPSSTDMYMWSFLRDEIVVRGNGHAEIWQKTLESLCETMFEDGIPVHRLNLESHKEQQRYARNTEESILACLNACASVTDRLGELRHPSVTGVGAWIKKLQGQRSGPGNTLALTCLSRLKLSDCILDIADLYGANLYKSDLSGANLHYCVMASSFAIEANLSGVHAAWGNFEESNMKRAKFTGSDLSKTRFESAKLEEVCFDNANLKHATFDKANLQDAKLSAVEAEQASFRSAELSGADFSYASLRGADFWRADLKGANFSFADLREAKFGWADIEGANFNGAQLQGTTLEKKLKSEEKRDTPERVGKTIQSGEQRG